MGSREDGGIEEYEVISEMPFAPSNSLLFLTRGCSQPCYSLGQRADTGQIHAREKKNRTVNRTAIDLLLLYIALAI